MLSVKDRVKARLADVSRKPSLSDSYNFLGNKLFGLAIAEHLFYKYSLADEGLLTVESQKYGLDENHNIILAAGWIETNSFPAVKKAACKWVDLEVTGMVYPVKARDLNLSVINLIETKISYKFHQPALLAQALTRASAINEGLISRGLKDYQSLEFLGDRILGLVIADILHKASDTLSKRERTNLFISYTHNRGPLAVVGKNIGLAQAIIMGAGEDPANPKILSDHIEALLGAMWLDSNGNYEIVYTFIRQHWAKLLGLGKIEAESGLLKDGASILSSALISAHTEQALTALPSSCPSPPMPKDAFPALAPAIASRHTAPAPSRSYALVLKELPEKKQISVARKAEIPPSSKEAFPALCRAPASKAPVLNYASLLKRDKAPSPEKAAPGH
jgi:dsRNA-specific ribonuclease